MTVLTRYRYRWWAALGVSAALAVAGTLAGPFFARTFAKGPDRLLAASPVTGWTWPANPALIPGLLSSDQEIALNADVYPVAFVPVTDTAGLQQLQRLATTKSNTPHRIGFLALVVSHPKSDRAAVTTASQRMHRDRITIPWVVVLDPPATWQISAIQVYWPKANGIGHAVGPAALRAWQQATAPIVVTSTQVVPHHRTVPIQPATGTKTSPKTVSKPLRRKS